MNIISLFEILKVQIITLYYLKSRKQILNKITATKKNEFSAKRKIVEPSMPKVTINQFFSHVRYNDKYNFCVDFFPRFLSFYPIHPSPDDEKLIVCLDNMAEILGKIFKS
jgi:hypothetical protein